MFSVILHALTWWSIHPEHTSVDSYKSTSSWTFQQCLTQSITRLFCPSSWISWHSTAMFIVITGDMEGIHICSMQTLTMLRAWSSSVLHLYPLSWWGPMGFHTAAMLMTWMAAQHLRFNPIKTELLYIPGVSPPCQDLCNLPGQLTELIIWHCRQPCGNHGQSTVLLASHR